MSTLAFDPSATLDSIDRSELRATVEVLAAIDRTSASAGEREAGEWIASRLRELGADVHVDEEEVHTGYARPCATLSAVGALGGLAALAGARRTGAALGALATAGLVDEAGNGPRVLRRATMAKGQTTNVIGEYGDPGAERTIVVLAHHDAAPTGRIFDPRAQEWFAERFPGIVERMDTAVPIWWPVFAGPALVALGSSRRRRRQVAAGTALAAAAAASFADIARSPTVPGANDNLTAVAALLALAERVRDAPVDGLRILLVSCGAEETMQEGIRAFGARHFGELDREATWFLNLDTVGSPRLMLLEGEGPVVMEDYHHKEFRDLVARCAERAGVKMRRGMRARSSTDSVIPSRAGYPTATLVSLDRAKALSNYHRMTDTPENVDYDTVARAVAVAEAVIRELGQPTLAR